jgi:hypothetical protein
MVAAKPQQKGVNGAAQRPHSTYFMQQNYEGQTNGWFHNFHSIQCLVSIFYAKTQFI